MKTISFFGGARTGKSPAYEQAALSVGRFAGARPCLAKFGASKNGLMGAFARGFLESAAQTNSGAKLHGVVPEKYVRVNQPETLGIEFTVTENLTLRKFHLLDKVDAFLILPGGTGTLDEIYEITEQDYLPVDRDPTYTDYNIRPIYILNVNGFYDHTIWQLEHMIAEGFIIREKLASLHFFHDLKEYEDALSRFFDN